MAKGSAIAGGSVSFDGGGRVSCDSPNFSSMDNTSDAFEAANNGFEDWVEGTAKGEVFDADAKRLGADRGFSWVAWVGSVEATVAPLVSFSVAIGFDVNREG